LAGDLRVGVRTMAPLAIFDPWLLQISQKNDSLLGFKAPVMIDFIRHSSQKTPSGEINTRVFRGDTSDLLQVQSKEVQSGAEKRNRATSLNLIF